MTYMTRSTTAQNTTLQIATPRDSEHKGPQSQNNTAQDTKAQPWPQGRSALHSSTFSPISPERRPPSPKLPPLSPCYPMRDPALNPIEVSLAFKNSKRPPEVFHAALQYAIKRCRM